MKILEFLNKELNDNYTYTSLNRVNWVYISCNKKLSENFIREFQNNVNWDYISERQKLSENFIREFKDKVNWHWISKYQKLSENFIKEFQGKVYWYYISSYQILSEDFIREFKDKVDWDEISECQKLSKKFRNEFNLKISKNNWLYKTTNFKKNKIVKCGLYECYENYFIAYKAIKYDRYSHYNFQYQYLPNQTYESHCDCTDNVDSFGLSVWTYEETNTYNNRGLIVKVKVKYEDVGRLVYGENKIRCFKIEVLE